MKFYFYAGLIFFIGSIILIIANYKDLDVQKNGSIVRMRIEKLPENCLGTRIKHFITLSYNRNFYIKRVGGKFCDDHFVGELIEVKFLDGSSTILFPNESVKKNLISFGLLGIFGLLIAFTKGIKKSKK
ncbi:MAG: hypothetical protein KGL19_01395 [Bacteroidota bacterium]|nr:hypothetical protein [Bacteroidota bacterium]